MTCADDAPASADAVRSETPTRGDFMVMVTISASYGAGGSVVGPRVAERLGVRFVDRAIPVEVARGLGISPEEAEELAHNTPGRWPRFLAAMASLSYDYAVPMIEELSAEDSELVDHTGDYLRGLAQEGGAVVLGHAAAVVLAGRPDALHVRFDGPADARIDAAMRQHGINRDTARAALQENDKLRSGYVAHFHHVDPTDPSLYDVVLDTTRLDWQQAEEIVVHAAGLGDRRGRES